MSRHSSSHSSAKHHANYNSPPQPHQSNPYSQHSTQPTAYSVATAEHTTVGQYSQQQQQQHGTTQYHHLSGATMSASGGGARTLTGERMITGSSVISERVIEHEIKIPKKVVREEVVEKVVVVPEKILHEEIVEEVQKVREKIIEIAKPVIKEKIVEVPQIEYVEKVVEVPEIVYKEKIRTVPVIEYKEKIIEVPRIVQREKIVEVPEYEYREVPVEKIVEVVEYHEETVVREVQVPQYVDKPVPEYVTREVPEDIDRVIPVPVEATTTFEFLLPKLKPKYEKVVLPIYAPRFVEVPMPAELIDSQMLAQAEHLSQQINLLASQQAPSLCEIERLAEYAKSSNFQANLSPANLQAAIEEAWKSGTLQISHHNGQAGFHTSSFRA